MSKVALIIGGTGGLGRGCAEELALKGYIVIVSGRNSKTGEEIVNGIKANKGEAIFFACDVSSHESIISLHKQVLDRYGRLDVAVNASGIMGPLSKLGDVPPEAVHEIMLVNVTGVIFSMQEQIRAMQATSSDSPKHIVNFSSIYGLHGCKYGPLYSATKHALVGLTKSAAVEYAKDNILVNCVSPGLVPTGLTADMDLSKVPEGEIREYFSKIMTMYPQGRVGEVKDVSRAVAYLVDSPWVTGTTLEIDGGFGAT